MLLFYTQSDFFFLMKQNTEERIMQWKYNWSLSGLATCKMDYVYYLTPSKEHEKPTKTHYPELVE